MGSRLTAPGFQLCLLEGLAVTFPASVLTDRAGNWNQNNEIGSADALRELRRELIESRPECSCEAREDPWGVTAKGLLSCSCTQRRVQQGHVPSSYSTPGEILCFLLPGGRLSCVQQGGPVSGFNENAVSNGVLPAPAFSFLHISSSPFPWVKPQRREHRVIVSCAGFSVFARKSRNHAGRQR